MTSNKPKTPHLGTRGLAFWNMTLSTFELSNLELELLLDACRTLDDLESLAHTLETDGITIKGSTGQTRIHPALSEIRQHRIALGRLLAQLQLPDTDGETLATPRQASARNAGRAGARARWNG